MYVSKQLKQKTDVCWYDYTIIYIYSNVHAAAVRSHTAGTCVGITNHTCMLRMHATSAYAVDNAHLDMTRCTNQRILDDMYRYIYAGMQSVVWPGSALQGGACFLEKSQGQRYSCLRIIANERENTFTRGFLSRRDSRRCETLRDLCAVASNPRPRAGKRLPCYAASHHPTHTVTRGNKKL